MLLSQSQAASWSATFLRATPDTHRGHCEGPIWVATGAKSSSAPHPVASLPQLGPAAGHHFASHLCRSRPGNRFPRPCFELESTPTKRAASLQVSIPNDGQAGQDASGQDVWTDGKAKGAGDLGHIPRWTQTLLATKDTGAVWLRPSESSHITEDPGLGGDDSRLPTGVDMFSGERNSKHAQTRRLWSLTARTAPSRTDAGSNFYQDHPPASHPAAPEAPLAPPTPTE